MLDENVTLIGYNSKKQAYIFLVASATTFITAVLCFFFTEGNQKYASIVLVLIAIGFLVEFCNLIKQPKIALKIFSDRYIYFYSLDGEKQIDIHSVVQVNYWPASMGLKITFVTEQGNEYFAYLLENAKQVKEYLLYIFERNKITVVRKYSK